jgi:hypothetical protein
MHLTLVSGHVQLFTLQALRMVCLIYWCVGGNSDLPHAAVHGRSSYTHSYSIKQASLLLAQLEAVRPADLQATTTFYKDALGGLCVPLVPPYAYLFLFHHSLPVITTSIVSTVATATLMQQVIFL